MTIDELYKIAEQCWEGCHGCTEQDKAFWVNGFVRGVLKFADIESLPSPSDYNQLTTDNFKDLI
jgi:hypothetical protein